MPETIEATSHQPTDHAARHAERARQSELWSADLDWYLTCRDSACGVRSGLGATIATIERGVSTGSAPNTDPYHDGQVGLGPAQERAFGKDHRMRERWQQLDEVHRVILRSHYGERAPCDPQTSEPPPFAARLGAEAWTRANGQLGALTRVTLLLSPEAIPGWTKAWLKGASARGVDGAMRRAEAAIREAHAAWYALAEREAADWAEGSPQ